MNNANNSLFKLSALIYTFLNTAQTMIQQHLKKIMLKLLKYCVKNNFVNMRTLPQREFAVITLKIRI